MLHTFSTSFEDAFGAEDLGVWQLVFPSDSTYLSKAAHAELFQDLETRAIRGSRLWPITESRKNHSAVHLYLRIQPHTKLRLQTMLYTSKRRAALTDPCHDLIINLDICEMVPPRQQNLSTTFSASLSMVTTGLLGACVGEVDVALQSSWCW